MQTPIVYGVDVAKAELVIAGPGASCVKLANRASEISRWLEGIPVGSFVAMESTGSMHRLLAQLAHRHGMTVFVLNPRDIHHYARALGSRGKTDRNDAEVIARYVAAEHGGLRPYVPASELQERIDLLLRKRASVVCHRDALRKSLSELPGLSDAAMRAMRSLAELLTCIDDQLEELVGSEPALVQRSELLRTMPGVGPLTSVSLANLLERVKLANADALVAFVGLDPKPNDSGQHRGRRRLSKRGPSEIRRLLYCAALTAARGAWKPLYEALRSRGLASTQAVCVIARKLLRVAWAMCRTNSPYNPALAPKPLDATT